MERRLVAKGERTVGGQPSAAVVPGTRGPPRKILEEDEYIKRLGAILRRDFFPQLAKLEAQYDYLTAMERDDILAIRGASARLSVLEKAPARSAEDAPNMTLDEFQSRFVTEDTAEFEQLLERINNVKRSRLANLYKRQAPLLLPAVAEAAPPRGRLLANNTRFKDRRVELPQLLDDPEDLRHQYWKMVREYAPEQSERSVTTCDSRNNDDINGYELVETPLVRTNHPRATPGGERRFTIPETPRRELLGHAMVKKSTVEKRKQLMKSPAVRRLIRAHTPKVGNVFDHNHAPKTPRQPG